MALNTFLLGGHTPAIACRLASQQGCLLSSSACPPTARPRREKTAQASLGLPVQEAQRSVGHPSLSSLPSHMGKEKRKGWASCTRFAPLWQARIERAASQKGAALLRQQQFRTLHPSERRHTAAEVRAHCGLPCALFLRPFPLLASHLCSKRGRKGAQCRTAQRAKAGSARYAPYGLLGGRVTKAGRERKRPVRAWRAVRHSCFLPSRKGSASQSQYF